MTVDLVFCLKAIAIGLATGLLSGGFGVGGGILCTPLLRIVMGEQAHVAIGTTMALIVPTSVAAAYNYFKKGHIDTALARKLAPMAVLGTIFGAWLTTITDGQVLMLLFSGLIAFAGLDLTFGFAQKLKKKREQEESGGSGSTGESAKVAEKNDAPVAVEGPGPYVLGAVAGLMAGFFGVGGGFLMIPCMLYFFRCTVKAAFGTSLLVVAAVSIPGTIAHMLENHVSLPLAGLMILGSVPGSFLGSSISMKLKDSSLRTGFGVVLLIMAVLLAYEEIF